MDYQPHELSLAWPDMPADQFGRLVSSLRDYGFDSHHPIVLHEGKILDGRHRYKACLETGITPQFRDFDGDDPVAFVMIENRNRRHATESQIAHAIAAMADYERAQGRKRQSEAGGDRKSLGASGRQAIADTGRTANKLAEKAGVSPRSVSRGIYVRDHGTDELNQAVAAGDITVTQAEKIARLNPAAQNRIVDTPKAQRSEELRKSMNRSDACKRRGNNKGGSKIKLPEQPSTPFVRKFLSGVERIAINCAEDGAKDGAAIAARFLDEMDWEATALTIQLERCEPVLRALAIIRQHKEAA